jgi:hypothetical protein
MFYVYRNTEERNQAIAKFNTVLEANTYMEWVYNGNHIDNATGYAVVDYSGKTLTELEL